MKKNSKSRAFWDALLDQYEAGTSKTQQQFAAEHGVNLHTFKNRLHLRRKARRDNDTQLTPFLELSPSAPESAVSPVSSIVPPAAALQLPNHVAVHFHSLPEPRYMALLLNSLRGV